MKRTGYFVTLFFLAIFSGCGTARYDTKVEKDFVLQPGMKIQVVDVANDTSEIFDVDVIGLFWDALEKTLLKENLLWRGGSPGAPLKMEARIVKYKKGNALVRWTVPGFGSTVLDGVVDLKNGEELIASVELHYKIAVGDGLTIGGWRKVFEKAAQDVVNELKVKLGIPQTEESEELTSFLAGQTAGC